MRKIFKILNLIFKNDVSIFRTIFFNFHYFPFSDAIRFPIILYKSVRLKKTKGQIIIDTLPIKPGMVHIGIENYGFHLKHDNTIWEQNGGTVIFEDGIIIGKGNFISIGENATLRVDQKTHFGGNSKIICLKSITIKAYTQIAWDVQIIDTDFHPTINVITKGKSCETKPIIIGNNNWLCFGCTVLKGTITPNYCIVAAKTLISGNYSNEGENIVIDGENNAKVVVRNIRADFYSE
jgi:acetyltransferase-like isoleucine patch superfamily enzyme